MFSGILLMFWWYVGSYGKHNKIKALPEYLIGADFIRTHIIDKIYRGKAFITFTAKAGIDVVE